MLQVHVPWSGAQHSLTSVTLSLMTFSPYLSNPPMISPWFFSLELIGMAALWVVNQPPSLETMNELSVQFHLPNRPWTPLLRSSSWSFLAVWLLSPLNPSTKTADIPLVPYSNLSPLQRSWDFPLACAIFLGSDWTEAPGPPRLQAQGCHDWTAPFCLFTRLQEIKTSKEYSLTLKFPALLWPPAADTPAVDQPTQGWFIFSFWLF